MWVYFLRPISVLSNTETHEPGHVILILWKFQNSDLPQEIYAIRHDVVLWIHDPSMRHFQIYRSAPISPTPLESTLILFEFWACGRLRSISIFSCMCNVRERKDPTKAFIVLFIGWSKINTEEVLWFVDDGVFFSLSCRSNSDVNFMLWLI